MSRTLVKQTKSLVGIEPEAADKIEFLSEHISHPMHFYMRGPLVNGQMVIIATERIPWRSCQ